MLDRTKEPGAIGEPLYLDVLAALAQGDREARVIGGRYGLASKEFTPGMIRAVFDELAREQPRRHFTVGIHDDVTHLSLDWKEEPGAESAGTSPKPSSGGSAPMAPSARTRTPSRSSRKPRI